MDLGPNQQMCVFLSALGAWLNSEPPAPAQQWSSKPQPHFTEHLFNATQTPLASVMYKER